LPNAQSLCPLIETFADKRRLRNGTFCPISASGSNFIPRNIQYIPVFEILAFLELEKKLPFSKGLKENTSSEQNQPVFITGTLLNSTNMIYLVKVKKKMLIHCSS